MVILPYLERMGIVVCLSSLVAISRKLSTPNGHWAFSAWGLFPRYLFDDRFKGLLFSLFDLSFELPFEHEQ